MRHPPLVVTAALVAFGLGGFSAPRPVCACGSSRPATLAAAAPVALEVICTAYPGDRSETSVREEAMEHGFEFWGEFSEIAVRGGSLEVRPGARPGQPCGLRFMTDAGRRRSVERALEAWARRQGLSRQGPRDWKAAGAGRLSWSTTPGVRGGAPDVIDAVYQPPSDD